MRLIKLAIALQGMRAYLLGLLTGLTVLCAGANASESDVSRVVFETGLGKIVVEIQVSKAPKTSAYFLGFVDRGEYDGSAFYRAGSVDSGLDVQLIQGGLFTDVVTDPQRQGADDIVIPMLADFETTLETGLVHKRATLSLARDLLGTGDAIPEFVFVLRDAPQLDHGNRGKLDSTGFPAFGEVIEGMEVVAAIAAQDVAGETFIDFLEGQILTEPVVVKRVYRAQD